MKRKCGKNPQEHDYNCLIYYSNEDKSWIAHSLLTDQLGYGDCPLTALADLMKVINKIFILAQQESNIEIFRRAPADILRRAVKAKELPGEIYEIAHKMANGEWPAEFPELPARNTRTAFKTDYPKDVPSLCVS